MNNELLEIDKDYFKRKREQAEKELNSDGLPKVVRNLDTKRYFPSEDSAALCDIIEETMAVFLTVREKLSEHFRYDGKKGNERFEHFLNLYAAFTSATIGHNKIVQRFTDDNVPYIPQLRTDLTQNTGSLFDEYRKCLLISMTEDRVRSTSDLVGVTRLYLKEMRDLALDKKEKFAEFLPMINNLSLQVNGDTITGFELSGDGYDTIDVSVD